MDFNDRVQISNDIYRSYLSRDSSVRAENQLLIDQQHRTFARHGSSNNTCLMSVTACSGSSSSTSLSRRTANAMANEHSRLPLRPTHFQIPIPPIGESFAVKPTRSKPPTSSSSPATSRHHFTPNESVCVKSSKQLYTHSNPPCELRPIRRASNSSLLRQRVSSAPDENSPRSRLNQPKALSANDSMTLRSYGEKTSQSVRSSDFLNRTLKHDDKQRDSLNALIKEQRKSKVPQAVQKRRIVFLFHHPPSKYIHPIPPLVSGNSQIPVAKTSILPSSSPAPASTNHNLLQVPDSFEPLDNSEPDMADSMQLAAILAEIQQDKDWAPTESTSKEPITTLDSSKYEYDVPNALDSTTFKLSPRTLKPDEELAARKRFAQYYQSEMRSSANAKIPSLIASIVTENNTTMSNGVDVGPTFTFKWNGTETLKKSTSTDDEDLLESSTDNELVQLCYDATLKLFCDPNTGKYYDLSSA